MNFRDINSTELIDKQSNSWVIDVRSPNEYLKGHIPNSYNMPLFNNDERAIIGTLYKQSGREIAIKKALSFMDGKLLAFYEIILNKLSVESKPIIIYCWRGGLRSQHVANFLSTFKFKVFRLERGYKNYRALVNSFFKKKLPLVVLGGMTGTGKTEILHELEKQKEQVFDLEGYAKHYGSAFGYWPDTIQPSTEHFANMLFEKGRHFDLNRRIWIENESRLIGKVQVPEDLWPQMRAAKVIQINNSIENRVEHLHKMYASRDKKYLIDSASHIEKRFGKKNTQLCIQFIQENNMPEAIALVLSYYDKTYKVGIKKRETSSIMNIECKNLNFKNIARQLITLAEEKTL